jgi:hypothetical protein
MIPKTQLITLKFYADPGHGWVAVKRKLLDELGIADKITSYSYQKGKTAYLEEDLDLGTLIKALDERGIGVRFTEKHTNRYSPIRNYYRYMA